jgi:twitching motility two-component system response regulator PilH
MYKGKKLLIIDDSPTERLKTKLSVKSLQFEIFEASNALEGIQKAGEIKPDLILMDVVMPGMNGFQATKQLSMIEELKNIPVIMCTSKNQQTDKIWGTKQGAKAYVVKPVEEAQLINAIQEVLDN